MYMFPRKVYSSDATKFPACHFSSRTCRVSFDANTYSVPAQHAQQLLSLKAYPERIRIFDSERLVAEHDAEAEGVVGLVALDHGDAVLREVPLHQDGEVEARRAAADDRDAHGRLQVLGM